MNSRTPTAFLAGDSSVGRLLRERDWFASPVGVPQNWPQSLKSVVNVMLGSAFPMFVAWGPGLTLLYNDAYSRLIGIKHPAALGQPLYEVWTEIEADLLPLVKRALGGESFFMEDLPLRIARQGFEEDAWFTFSYSPVQDESGEIAGIFCACTETTQTVQAARQQGAELQRLQTLFSQAPGFLALMRGPNHVFEMVNPAFLQTIGFRDLIGKSVADALPEVVDQGFVNLLDTVFQTGKPFVGRSLRLLVNREQGSPLSEAYVDFVYQPLLDASGQVEGILVQGHEVTEQHRAQEALLVFSNSIPAIAWVANRSGMVERFNLQWESYTGQPTESAMGRGWMQAIHPDDQAGARLAWEASRDGCVQWHAEYRLRRHDGVYRWFHVRCLPQLDASGQVMRWFGTTTDIEDERQAAHALREADRQKDEFLATLSHELRNPLAPILTSVQLIASPLAGEDQRRRAVEVIGRQVTHMARLLDDLIDIARVTQQRMLLKKEAVTVESVVRAAIEVAQPQAAAKKHQLSVHVEAPQTQLWADPVRLTQVLSNLLNNAAKYTDPGGKIGLDVRLENREMVFSVFDNGIGLTADAIDHIFAMFAQEKSALDRSDGGLGIGLALARGLVELHGGNLSARSAGPGHGSCFVVRLPVATQMPEPAPAPAAPQSYTATGARRSIVLADDNRDAAETLAEFLRMDGHVVHTAHDGLEAAALAMNLKPDVMVLDIGMPGLNGYEVARRIRSQPWGSAMFLVAATGWGQDGDRQKSQAAGFDLHLTKPFDPLELGAVIGEARPGEGKTLPNPVILVD